MHHTVNLFLKKKMVYHFFEFGLPQTLKLINYSKPLHSFCYLYLGGDNKYMY